MATTLVTQEKADLKTYSGLKSAIRSVIARGKERAIQAVEREKVRTSWEVDMGMARRGGDLRIDGLRRAPRDEGRRTKRIVADQGRMIV